MSPAVFGRTEGFIKFRRITGVVTYGTMRWKTVHGMGGTSKGTPNGYGFGEGD